MEEEDAIHHLQSTFEYRLFNDRPWLLTNKKLGIGIFTKFVLMQSSFVWMVHR